MGGEVGLSIERPPHTVALTYDFYMGVYEVDQLLFSVVMGFNPIKVHGNDCEGLIFPPEAEEPAYCVSWFEAVRFANKLSERDGLEQCYEVVNGMLYWTKGLECEGYRLPTEKLSGNIRHEVERILFMQEATRLQMLLGSGKTLKNGTTRWKKKNQINTVYMI